MSIQRRQSFLMLNMLMVYELFLEKLILIQLEFVAIGRKVKDLLANPEDEERSSISVELCGGTHISNTREAKAFVLLSEKGIAKGIRRGNRCYHRFCYQGPELAEASKAEGDLLEHKVTSMNGRVESAHIPTAKKTDLKAKISLLQNQVIKSKKSLVCAGVPDKSDKSKKLNVLEWLKMALKPLNGKGGGGKGGLAQGQGSVISNVQEAMKDAETYAEQKLKEE